MCIGYVELYSVFQGFVDCGLWVVGFSLLMGFG